MRRKTPRTPYRLHPLPYLHRQREEKSAAFARFAFYPYLTAMHLNEFFRQRQAQPGAFRFALGTRFHLLELLEYPLLFRCRYARPVSPTSTRTLPASRWAFTHTCPASGVNLMALPTKFKSTCLIRAPSMENCSRLSSFSTRRSIDFLVASARIVCCTDSNTSCKNAGSNCSSILPDSTLARSRISLIRLSRCLPLAKTSVKNCERSSSVTVERGIEQDFGKADDRVERRAQLVRHVGEKFRLMPIGRLDLPALVFDLTE